MCSIYVIRIQYIQMVSGKIVTDAGVEIRVNSVPCIEAGVLATEGGTTCGKQVNPSDAAASSKTIQHDLQSLPLGM